MSNSMLSRKSHPSPVDSTAVDYHVIIIVKLLLLIDCCSLLSAASFRVDDHGRARFDDVISGDDRRLRRLSDGGSLMTSLLSTGNADAVSNYLEDDYATKASGVGLREVKLLDHNDVIYDVDDYQNDEAAYANKWRTSPVTAAEFRDRVLRPEASYRDVIRVFVKHGDSMSDDDVDDLITAEVTSHPAEDVHDGDEWQQTMAAVGRTSSGTTSGWKLVDVSENRLVELNRAFSHVTEMMADARTECRLPVAEVVRVNALFRHANRLYLPECTVLHRCQGDRFCCHGNAECAAKSSTVVTLFFIEMKFFSTVDQYEPYPSVKALNFINDTECYCKPLRQHRPRQQYIKCLRCPAPFVLNDEDYNDVLDTTGNDRCGCRCDGEHCLDVARGRVPLGHQELTCLHRSECQQPTCNFGSFDLDTGYCPCAALDVACVCSRNEALPECTSTGGSGDIDHNHRPEVTSFESQYNDEYDEQNV